MVYVDFDIFKKNPERYIKESINGDKVYLIYDDGTEVELKCNVIK